MKEEKSKNSKKVIRKKKNNKKMLAYLIILLIVLYMGYVVWMLLQQPTSKFTVEEGTLYSEETNIGYIIREERVVKGENYKNGMEQIKTEGEKAAKGDSIYRYYSKNEEELTKKIAELDKKVQESLEGQKNILPSDVKMLENQIDEKLELISKTSDISKLTEYKKDLNNLITKKSKIIGEESKAGTYLKELYNQRTTLEQQLNSGAEYIKAPESGIVSYKVDGLEETLTPNNFSTLNKEFLEKLNLKTGQIIATNDECGKVINNFTCYIAMISNSKQAKECEIGKKVKVRLSNNKVIPARITYTSQENEEETLLIIEINEQIEELTNYRKISLDLIWWSYSGLKVPNDALVEEEELSYVVRNRAGYLNKILVKVEKQNDKYSIVSNYKTEELRELGYTDTEIINIRQISIYDELIIKPDISKLK